ncbi:MAG: SRPBCC family protein [Chloroflexota bacterium]|nr:SRPBCC family protein [Chloroflexota bacterium]PLS77806.1 MAG: hypothetical protein CYG59_21890 [Chloroflexota bacterium]
MDIRWQGEIHIAASYDVVYEYLANFPRHAEWAQTIERMEQRKQGDEYGVGAQYHTWERQGMQSNRAPGEPITMGRPVETLAEVRELSPSYRIVWQARTVQKPLMSAELSFDLKADAGGGTRLLQRIYLHTSKPYDLLDKLRHRTDPVILRAQLRAQWEAGLRNIKEIVEGDVRARQRLVNFPVEAVDVEVRERHV